MGLAWFLTQLRWPWGMGSTGNVCEDSWGSDFHKGDRTQSRAMHLRLRLVTGIYKGLRELWSLRGGEGGEGSRIFLICTHFLSPVRGGLGLDLEGKVRYPGAGKMVQLWEPPTSALGLELVSTCLCHKPDVMVCICNPSNGEAETGASLELIGQLVQLQAK